MSGYLLTRFVKCQTFVVFTSDKKYFLFFQLQIDEESEARLNDSATFQRLGMRETVSRLDFEAKQLETRALSPIQVEKRDQTAGDQKPGRTQRPNSWRPEHFLLLR